MTNIQFAKLKIAQIDSNFLSKKLFEELLGEASFIDTDKNLNEFMTRVDVLSTISTEFGGANKDTVSGRKLIQVSNEAFDLYKKLKNYHYIQVINI